MPTGSTGSDEQTNLIVSQPKKNAEDSLAQLAEYLRHGWKAKYPVEEKDFARLHDKMREIWKKKEQNKTNELGQSAHENKVPGQELEHGAEQEPEQDQSQDSEQENDQGHEHER